jgi:hypothetical protein
MKKVSQYFLFYCYHSAGAGKGTTRLPRQLGSLMAFRLTKDKNGIVYSVIPFSITFCGMASAETVVRIAFPACLLHVACCLLQIGIKEGMLIFLFSI